MSIFSSSSSGYTGSEKHLPATASVTGRCNVAVGLHVHFLLVQRNRVVHRAGDACFLQRLHDAVTVFVQQRVLMIDVQADTVFVGGLDAGVGRARSE